MRINVGLLGKVALGLGAGIGLWAIGGWWSKRGAEEPAFESLGRDGQVELRRYGPAVLAVTDVEGERDAALNEGFRRLAGYIFGGNHARDRIAMTTPVAQGPSEKIAMTTPVAQSRAAGSDGIATWRVAFTMPPGRTLESLPLPDDTRVRFEAVPARTVAVVRFSGRAGDGDYARGAEALRAWAERNGREIEGEPELAQYDPPWIMPPLRRNEVMVPVRESQAGERAPKPSGHSYPAG